MGIDQTIEREEEKRGVSADEASAAETPRSDGRGGTPIAVTPGETHNSPASGSARALIEAIPAPGVDSASKELAATVDADVAGAALSKDAGFYVAETQDPPPANGSADDQDATREHTPQWVSGAKAGSENKPLVGSTPRAGSRSKTERLSQPFDTDVPEFVGDYEIEGELGRGGMGVVYLGRHRQLRRQVAIKMILAGPHAGPTQVSRFLTEAQAVARLDHPNVVRIYDIGEHEGQPYFSLEYVAGKTLASVVAKQPLPAKEAARIVRAMALAMQHAHDQGILHRDLKPSNVLMAGAEPKITDFGLAKQLDDADGGQTREGVIMGTPSYMSPEQARGDAKLIGPSADQYSLGAVLYQLMTGRPPFLGAKPLDTVMQVLKREPVAPRVLVDSAPVDLETICLKAMRKEADKRYDNCKMMADDLGRFLDGRPILARPVSKAEQAWRWVKQNPRVAIPSITSVVLFLTAFVGALCFAAVLSDRNTQLQKATKTAIDNAAEAERQGKIAEQNANAEMVARARADTQTETALNTFRLVFNQIVSQIGKTPGLQPLKHNLVKTAAVGLEKMPEFTGKSGITTAATVEVYHDLLYRMHMEIGETEQAWPHVEKAFAIASERVQSQNGTSASRLNLAAVYRDMATMRQSYRRDMRVSLDLLSKAIGVYEDVLARPIPKAGDPPRWVMVNFLSQTHSQKGTLEVKLGQPATALGHFLKIESLRREILDDADFKKLSAETQRRQREIFREESAATTLAIGNMQFRLGNPSLAVHAYGQVLKLREEYLKQFPNSIVAKHQVANALSSQAELRIWMGEPAVAKTHLARTVGLATEVTQQDPKIVDYQRTLALAHYRLGVAKTRLGEADASANFEACRQIRLQLAGDTANIRRQIEYALVLPHVGRYEEAAKLGDKLQETPEDNDADFLLDLARVYSQCWAGEKDPAARTKYRDQALRLVGLAVEKGNGDPVYLRVEADLAPLRDEPAFRQAVTRASATLEASRAKPGFRAE